MKLLLDKVTLIKVISVGGAFTSEVGWMVQLGMFPMLNLWWFCLPPLAVTVITQSLFDHV